MYTPYNGCVSSNSAFTVVCARDLNGGEINGYTGIATCEACIALCANNPDCDAVSYDMGSKTCVHKSDVYFGNPSSNPKEVCAYRLVNYAPPQYTGGSKHVFRAWSTNLSPQWRTINFECWSSRNDKE
jgi:hypothetical protein